MSTKTIIKMCNILGYIVIVSSIILFFIEFKEIVIATTILISGLISAIVLFAIADALDSLRAIVNNSAQIYKVVDKNN